MAFYSQASKQLAAPLPAGWDPNSIAAVALSAEKAQPASVQVHDNKLFVDVEAQRPVIVFRDSRARP